MIVPAVDDYRTVFEAIRAVEDQTAFARLELLLVIPSLAGFAAPADFASRHPRARLIENGRRTQLHEARAIGIREALADWVFLLEDHCLPFPDCMENLLNRISKTWEVVGPAIVCGNRRSVFGKAANLLTYGEWMGCSEAGERRYVTGYSSVWRRETLLQLGPVLEWELAIPSRLQKWLRARGKRLFFEPAAVMVHWEASWLGGISPASCSGRAEAWVLSAVAPPLSPTGCWQPFSFPFSLPIALYVVSWPGGGSRRHGKCLPSFPCSPSRGPPAN